MSVGDMLILLTDGFYEWDRGDGEQFGTERVVDLIRQHRARPAKEIIEAIYAELLGFAGESIQADDLTAVIVKRIA